MEIELDNIISLIILPEEIIREILLRLPVKSLLRFRCVSKPWLSLISSHKFANAHLLASTNNKKYIQDKLIFGPRDFRPLPIDLYTCSIQSVIEGSNSEVYSATNDNNLLFDRVQLDYPYARLNVIPQIVGSCNGLVCVCLSLSITILWNPTTREWKRLPHPGSDYILNNVSFGYDELHDDYKVVWFLFARNVARVYEARVRVYSLRTNSWNDVLNWTGKYTCSRKAGKFLNGSLHYSVIAMNKFSKRDIVSLDLANDTFAQMRPPPDKNAIDVQLGIFGGCLGVYYRTFHDNMVVLWVMKEYGVRESWTQVVRIPFQMQNMGGSELFCPRPVFLLADGKILINYGSSLKIYDPSNPRPHQFNNETVVEATAYVESLVSLTLDDEEEHD